jgi:cell division protein FtsQ
VTHQDPERLRRSGAFAPHDELDRETAAAPAALAAAENTGQRDPGPGVPGPGGSGLGGSGLGGSGLGGDGPGGLRNARRPHNRQRRPLDPWKAAFVLIALAGIVAAVAWALLGSRFFVVRGVRVTGLHRVSRSQALAAAAVPMGLPLIRVDTAAVSRRVDAITQVQSAQVTRSWPDAIVINVTERTPALAVANGSGYDLVDRFGVVVVSAAPRLPRGMPIFRPAGRLRGNPAVAAAVAVLHELPAGLAGRLRWLAAPSADGVTLHLSGGVTVIWGAPGRAAAKARVLAVLMRTHARIYDVSQPTIATTR